MAEDPSDETPGIEQSLAEVTAADEAIDAARRGLFDAVARARAAGASYSAIGTALGVSRQAAWERFGKDAGDPDDGS